MQDVRRLCWLLLITSVGSKSERGGLVAPARRSRWRRGLAALLAVAAGLVALVAVALFGVRYVPPDAFAASPDTLAMVVAFTDLSVVGGFVAVVLALLALALARHRGVVVVTVLCVVALAVPAAAVAPRWASATGPTGERSFTVLALNSLFGRADPTAVARAAATADVVVLTEATRSQLRGLAATGFDERFRYRSTDDLPRDGAGGTIVFSRYRVSATKAYARDLPLQAWVCTLDLPGVDAPLTVAAVHPGRPELGGTHWLPQQEEVRANLPLSGLRLLAGDFNAVDSHPTMRAIRDAGWRSSVDDAGAGWVPTYPADSSTVPPLIDIDHVYLAGGLRATRVESVRVPGTDHLGLLVTVTVTGSA